ncbi:MAG TPA: hypothetical protein PKN75_01875 [Bacteroidia bacterium]|nr:hypothetical protein [Bacteroidia bacterium]HNU32323.1 hypothetical protein [Bacteroidia bacterium]
MQFKFKSKFWRDIEAHKADKEIMRALNRVSINVEKVEKVSNINNIKQLEKFESRYRIKLLLDKKRDFRIGLYIHGNTLWFARFVSRKKIYDVNW